MTSKELQHIFGVTDRKLVPFYSIAVPNKSTQAQNNDHFYNIVLNSEQYSFHLKPFKSLLSAAYNAVMNFGNESLNLNGNSQYRHCIYAGESTSHGSTYISLVGCGKKTRGMVINSKGEFFMIQPMLEKHHRSFRAARDTPSQEAYPHIIYKRSTSAVDEIQHSTKSSCFFRDHNFTYAETEIMDTVADRLQVIKGPLTIELAAFVDDAMWYHFDELYGEEADSELHQFILASVNNTAMTGASHQMGDAERLLDNFCQYQNDINPKYDSNPRHWDHALLFSGYDIYDGLMTSVAGYAPVQGMCSETRSCTINEGLDFGAVFVMTHEMGHSLGMYHDGRNGCDTRCCIMSPSVGFGKTSWSSCSVQEFHVFLKKFGKRFYPDNCLTDGIEDDADEIMDHSVHSTLPGQRYNLDEQCSMFYGSCWKHELKHDQTMEWCFEGKCRAWTSGAQPLPIHGGWTEWSDDGDPGLCGVDGQCTTCTVSGQLRVRRSVRRCQNPSPNNGGEQCVGSADRAVICDTTPCEGPDVNRYATKICSELKNDRDVPQNSLSGEGFQYKSSPCAIWCRMERRNFIRTIANFPDGTPCGKQSYCIKGECKKLHCGMKAIVSDKKDCPTEIESSNVTEATTVEASEFTIGIETDPEIEDGSGTTFELTTETESLTTISTTTTAPLFVPEDDNELEEISTDFGQSTTSLPISPIPRVRYESTTASEIENKKKIPPLRRSNSNEGPTSESDLNSENQTKVTSTMKATTVSLTTTTNSSAETAAWEDWTVWSVCTVSCGGGFHHRTRSCTAGPGQCQGISLHGKTCNFHACKAPSANLLPRNSNLREKKLSKPLPRPNTDVTEGSGEQSSWNTWLRWSPCDITCGKGRQRRDRKCDGELDYNFCTGESDEYRTCNDKPCPSPSLKDYSAWSTWSACSRSCAGGSQTRKRVCLKKACFGSTLQRVGCNRHRCRPKAQSSYWTEWPKWSPCSSSCGDGLKARLRHCRGKGVCPGSNMSVASCKLPSCAV